MLSRASQHFRFYKTQVLEYITVSCHTGELNFCCLLFAGSSGGGGGGGGGGVLVVCCCRCLVGVVVLLLCVCFVLFHFFVSIFLFSDLFGVLVFHKR